MKKTAGKMTIARMLVATDGSEESIDAARYAAALSRALRPRVILLHVIPTPSIPTGTSSLGPKDKVEIEKAMWDGAQAILERAREPFQEVSVPAELMIRAGDAAKEIVKVAQEEKTNLIVVASHGAGRAARAVLGSTSDAVARSAPCPVLVARKGTVG